MKKIYFLFIFACYCMLMVACKKDDNTTPFVATKVTDLKKVPQFKTGNYWIYILREFDSTGAEVKSYTDSVWVVSDTTEKGMHYSVLRSSLSGSRTNYLDSAGIILNDLKNTLYAPKAGLLSKDGCYTLTANESLESKQLPAATYNVAQVVYQLGNCPIPLDISQRYFFYADNIGLVAYEDRKANKVLFDSRLLRYKVKP